VCPLVKMAAIVARSGDHSKNKHSSVSSIDRMAKRFGRRDLLGVAIAGIAACQKEECQASVVARVSVF